MNVSVIVPSLNEEANIGKCLKSIRSQKTSLEYETIVSDSGSTDKTRDIAADYADKVINIRRKGIWRGRNAGAKQAWGKVLVFIDADTVIPRNYLDSVCPILDDMGIAGLSCSFEFSEKSTKLRLIEDICNEYLLFRGSMGKGEILGFNAAVRKQTFAKARGFPNAPLEDGALAIKLRKLGRVVYLPEPKVVTSSRRIQKQGTIKSTIYYAQLSLETSMPKNPLKRLLHYRKYIEVR